MRVSSTLAVLLLTLSTARAQEPASFVLSHQGRLLAADDSPAEGQRALTFRLYASPVPLPGESSVWEETYEVTVSNGVYGAVLGDETHGRPLTTAELDGATPRYLSVSVDGGPELLPRQRVGAVPYAVNAERLGNLAAADYLTRADADDLYLAKTDAASTYLTSARAEEVYLTTEAAETTYLPTAEAAQIYETRQAAANTYLDKTTAANTYLDKTTAANTYLDKTTAANTYLDKTTAAATYATKEEIADVARQADLAPLAKTADVQAGLDSANARLSGLELRDAPIGSVVAWVKSLPGTPELSDGWVECNGQVLSDPASPYDGQTIPDLNAGRFLRGSSTSGATGGSETHTHTFTATYNQDLVPDASHFVDGAYTNPANHLPPFFEVVWVMKVK